MIYKRIDALLVRLGYAPIGLDNDNYWPVLEHYIEHMEARLKAGQLAIDTIQDISRITAGMDLENEMNSKVFQAIAKCYKK